MQKNAAQVPASIAALRVDILDGLMQVNTSMNAWAKKDMPCMLSAMHARSFVASMLTRSFFCSFISKGMYRPAECIPVRVCACAHDMSVVHAVLQDYIASAERALRKSKLEFGDLNYYKVQLQLIWSKEVVQNWVAAFTNVLTETQKAYDVVMDASKNKGQVCLPV